MSVPLNIDASLEGLPAMLKVEDAARVLGIGRSLAYQLVDRYFDSAGVEGLPVLRLGGVLRVPGFALRELIMTGTIAQLIPAKPTPSSGSRPRSPRTRRPKSTDRAQLSLLATD